MKYFQQNGSGNSEVIDKLLEVHTNVSKRMRSTVSIWQDAMLARRGDRKVKTTMVSPPPAVSSPSARGGPFTKSTAIPAEIKSPMDPVLADIKNLFAAKENEGVEGMRRTEFISAFGSAFLPGASEETLTNWFTSLDYDANGIVGWEEFCTFLMTSRHLPSTVDTHMQGFSRTPAFYEGKGHRDSIFACIHNTINDVYYTAGHDGCAFLWHPTSLQVNGKLFHQAPPGAMLQDMRWVATVNRVFILQSDRVVSVYDSSVMGRGRTALIKTLKGVDSFSRGLNPMRQRPQVQRYTEALPEAGRQAFGPELAAVLRGKAPVKKAKRVVTNDVAEVDDEGAAREIQMIDALPLLEFPKPTLTMDFAPTMGAGGSYLFGSDGGVVSCYRAKKVDAFDAGGLDENLHRPDKWKVHAANSYVTKVLDVPSLDGYISASTDQSIQIFNVEKSTSYVRMRDGATVTPIHSLVKRENRAVFGFDYSPELNLLVSWGENRKFVIWNPLTATCLFRRMEHTHPLSQVMFMPNYRLISLSVDKTIKIWDTRTFRCVQTLVDKHARLKEDSFRCLAWDVERQTIITGSSEPVLFRTKSVQERVEAGINVQRQVNGHVRPIITILILSGTGHLVSVDRECVITWHIGSGLHITAWYPEFLTVNYASHKLTAAAVSTIPRRMVLCCSDGNMYLVNAHKKIVLRVFNYGSYDEVTACTSLILNLNSEEHLLCAGVSTKIVMFHDELKIAQIGQVMRPVSSLALENYGFCLSMQFSAPSRLVVGTTKGYLLLFSLSNMSLISVSNDNEAAITRGFGNVLSAIAGTKGRRREDSYLKDLPAHLREEKEKDDIDKEKDKEITENDDRRDSAAEGKDPLRDSTVSIADPPPPTTGAAPTPSLAPTAVRSKMQNMISGAMTKARGMTGAQEFTAFQGVTQRFASQSVEGLACISSTVVVTVHGNGDACFWRIRKDTHQSSLHACIPASHTAGEAVRSVLYCASLQKLFIGDDEGYLSAFDVTELLIQIAKEEDLKRKHSEDKEKVADEVGLSVERKPRIGKITSVIATTSRPKKRKSSKGTARSNTNQHRIFLCLSITAHTKAINVLESLASDTETIYIITGSSDCIVKIWDSDGLPVATFGNKGGWSAQLSGLFQDVFKHMDPMGIQECKKEGAREDEEPDLDPDTREAVRTHYFSSKYPENVRSVVPVTTFGDVLAAEDAPAEPCSMDQKGEVEGADGEKGGGGGADAGVVLPAIDHGEEIQQNVQRMIQYSMKKTNDPELKRYSPLFFETTALQRL